MNSLFDKLNLRPGERRLVVIVAITVFILLNAFFVWPRFGEGTRLKNRMKTAENTLFQYQREVEKTAEYQRKLLELEKAGASVASEDQALKLSQTVLAQAALSGVQIVTYTPTPRTSTGGKTNQFFDEQSGILTIAPTEEKALVDFLYNLGIGGSMIRVFTMTLTHDPPRQKLQGSVTLVASYARKPPPRAAPAAAPARTNAPAVAAGAPRTTTPPRNTSTVSRAGSPFGGRTNPPSKK
jgi:hypothetical protein